MFDQPPAAPSAAPCRPPPSPSHSYPQHSSDDRAWRYGGVGLAGLVFLAGVLWANVADDAPAPATATAPPIPLRSPQAFDPYPESGTPMPVETAHLAADGIGSGSTVPADPLHETVVRIEKGKTFAGVLLALGVSVRQVADAVAALAPRVRLDRLPAGQALAVTIRTGKDAAPPMLEGLTVRPDPRREFTLERSGDGGYGVAEKIFETTARLQHASGTVDGSLIASAAAAGVPQPALAEMLRGFSWDVNFQYDIKAGDRFAALVERSWTSDGLPVDGGKVLWAEITTHAGRKTFSIYRFKPRGGREFFYDADGRSVVKALLRTPLNMARISSRFGMRHHPVLKFTRLHAGIDFAAPPGTPILAAGDGQVVEASPNGGYGRWIKIDHGGGLATGYAHMSRLAAGMRRGKRVRQSQVIGFVGSSGLSTGPHLHFELHRKGRPVNPLDVASTVSRTRLGGADLARFRDRVAETDSARADAPTSHAP